MLPDDPRHGTIAGYSAHRRAKVPSCEACRRAMAKDRQLLILRGGGLRDSAGAQRRIQAMSWMGWTLLEIARECGWPDRRNVADILRRDLVSHKTHARICAAADELAMHQPPEDGKRRNYIRNTAKRRGWVSLIAWDNIDDPNERPAIARDTWDESSIDDAVIDRVLAGGKRPRKLTRAEAGEIVARSIARGMSGNQIEALYGLKPERYVRGGERVA